MLHLFKRAEGSIASEISWCSAARDISGCPPAFLTIRLVKYMLRAVLLGSDRFAIPSFLYHNSVPLVPKGKVFLGFDRFAILSFIHHTGAPLSSRSPPAVKRTLRPVLMRSRSPLRVGPFYTRYLWDPIASRVGPFYTCNIPHIEERVGFINNKLIYIHYVFKY